MPELNTLRFDGLRSYLSSCYTCSNAVGSQARLRMTRACEAFLRLRLRAALAQRRPIAERRRHSHTRGIGARRQGIRVD